MNKEVQFSYTWMAKQSATLSAIVIQTEVVEWAVYIVNFIKHSSK
jgi:hypothetical protein